MKHAAIFQREMPERRMKFSWYVAYEVPKSLKQLGRRTPRLTKVFENELEAKEFARAKYAEGLNVNAGTINPHLPKRAIASNKIQEWLDENK